MKKQVFHDATTGILIGLILSIIFSFIHSPSNYAPLSPNSLIGQFMTQHQVHGSLVLLYCLLIWAAIGVLFSFGSRLFAQDWSLLRATVTHFFLMLLGFCSSSNSGRLVSTSLDFHPSTHPRVCHRFSHHLGDSLIKENQRRLPTSTNYWLRRN